MPRIEGQEWAAGGYRAPFLIVTIEINGKAIKTPAMVDSGSDVTLVPFEIIESLGVDYSSLDMGERAVSVGGRFETRVCKGKISFDKWEICTSFDVREPADPTQPGTFNYVLLGRADFFYRFIVCFNWNADPPYFDVDPV